ncbi:MAG TPA: hypothetical protein V6D12_13495 [Candidatus Obscuribacterales bacterium]
MPARSQFLGTLDERPSYSVELAKDAIAPRHSAIAFLANQLGVRLTTLSLQLG